MAPHEEQDEGTSPRKKHRRLAVVLLVLLFVLVLPIGALWARLVVSPMSLPDTLQSRVVARINGAMSNGDVTIGDMVLALPDGGRAPALELRDVSLNTPGGDVRAAFPLLRARVAPAPLLRGRMRVSHVVVVGAGLNLTRTADGRLDLMFADGNDPEGTDRTLVETLSRLDQMFASPTFANLEEVRGEGMEVLLSDAMAGRDMRLHDAEVRLARDAGRLSLEIAGELAGSRDASLHLNLVRDSAQGVTEVGMEFDTLAARDLAAASPALAWLDLMRAPIDGQLSARMEDDGTLGALSGWMEIGAGHLTLPGQAAPLNFDAMEAQIAYDPETGRATFNRLMLASAPLSFDAQGHADVREQGQVFISQFNVSDIWIDPDGTLGEAAHIDGAALDMRLTLGETVRVEVGQAVIHDGELRATAQARAIAGPDGMSIAIDGQMPHITLPDLLSYWPASAIPNTRWWVAERMIAGEVAGLDFAFRQVPGQSPNYEVSFDFNAADVRALPAAPPIRGASGFLSLQNQRLAVQLDGGSVGVEGQGAVALAGSMMLIEDVSVAGPLAQFDLDFSGSVPDLMHVLAGPPFAVLDPSGYAPGEIGTGQVTAEASLATHLVERPADAGLSGLDIDVNGIVTGFHADALITGRTLTSDRMIVTMTSEQLSVGGQAALDGVPVTGQWSVLLDPDAPRGSLVEARAMVDRAALETFGISMPDWLISGRGAADLTVALHPERAANLTVRSDLSGITLAIPPLAWRMPAARTGALNADITLGPRPEVNALTVEGAGLSLEGAVNFTADGWLNRFSVGRFRLGQWLDVRGGLVGRREDAPRIEVSGGILDFRTMPSLGETGGGGSGDVGPLDITLDRMQITEGIALTDLRAELDGTSMSGDFRGRVNGAVQVNGQLVPGGNGPSVRLQSGDGGAVMRAAGIFENMHGGAFDLILAARPEPGQYDGRLTIGGPRLRNAPVMAELLNLISVVGLIEQLSGEGINLGEVNADFRLTPSSITLAQGTAVGPAMGVSMDGVYDVASGRYEMQGVVSPFYLVNGLFGALFSPRREGLFGFNYRLIGNADDTRVSVNPLSILTPGIFREIFRAPPPDFSNGNGG